MADLYQRIEAMDRTKPYVWRLRISKAEFDALESAVQSGSTTALQTVVYLAEWYKRCYTGAESKPIVDFDSQQLKQIFEKSGIDPKGNLFLMENGNTSWRYSIYVLGGLALPFETGHHKFLRELCRIYYGEDGDVDQLGEKERATAFKESVRSFGCLYEFIQTVLGYLKSGKSGDAPFAAEDLTDAGSWENRFVAQIRSANDAVLKSKFALEWVIGFEPEAEYMTRKLRLILKPESLGGLNHQYLKFERVRLWGIAHPENVKRLIVGVRFLQDAAVVSEPDFGHPILEYSTTGNVTTGFVAWYTEQRSRKTDVPVDSFNAVELVVRDDSGQEHVIEKFNVDQWIQVFRVPDGYNEWTSQHFSQRDSALICPGDYLIHDAGLLATVYKKRFWAKGRGVSMAYQWRSIVDKVCFSDPGLKETTLYNRQGYDQIVIVPHNDILKYQDGRVSYTEESDGELEESSLPLVFGRSDIIVRHFETRNDLLEEPGSTEYEYEKIEFWGGGRYDEWTDTNVPKQGKTTLRITIKGVQRKLVAYILPKTIRRDCESGEIFCDAEVLEMFQLEKNGVPTDPVFHKSFGSDEEFVSLEIWRATKHKEFVRQGKVVQYVADGEAVEISYILKDGLRIRDFSSDGFREYRCDDISGIYQHLSFSPVDKGNLAALTTQSKILATELDGNAPSWLWVNLAKENMDTGTFDLLYWNYRNDVDPKSVNDETSCTGNDIVFQRIKGFDGLCIRPPRLGNYNAFRLRTVRAQIDFVRCFEVATEFHVYYFAMMPLRELMKDPVSDLYEPLKNRRCGEMTEAEKRGLVRMAEEMGFDWQAKHGITITI